MRRAFRRADQVRAVLQIYQGTERTDPIAPVSMRVQILDAKGVAVRDQSLPFTEKAFTNRRADCVITLPLAALQPGEYLLKLERPWIDKPPAARCDLSLSDHQLQSSSFSTCAVAGLLVPLAKPVEQQHKAGMTPQRVELGVERNQG